MQKVQMLKKQLMESVEQSRNQKYILRKRKAKKITKCWRNFSQPENLNSSKFVSNDIYFNLKWKEGIGYVTIQKRPIFSSKEKPQNIKFCNRKKDSWQNSSIKACNEGPER